MTPHDAPAVLLVKAQEDQHAMLLLIDESSVADAILGIHAQQAVEKAIKAVLNSKGVRYRRTHDIAELLDLLKASSIEYPAVIEEGVELTPFAAEMRYDYLPPEATPEIPINRLKVAALVAATIGWADTHIQMKS